MARAPICQPAEDRRCRLVARYRVKALDGERVLCSHHRGEYTDIQIECRSCDYVEYVDYPDFCCTSGVLGRLKRCRGCHRNLKVVDGEIVRGPVFRWNRKTELELALMNVAHAMEKADRLVAKAVRDGTQDSPSTQRGFRYFLDHAQHFEGLQMAGSLDLLPIEISVN